MYGDPDDVKVAAFCSSEPDAGSDVGAMRTRAVYDEAKDEWVLNGTKTWATNGGIANVHVVVAVVDPALGARGHASFIVPPAPPASPRARSSRSTASAPPTPPRSSSTTSASPATACSAARRSWTSASPGPARASGGRRKNAAMATFESSRPAVGAQAVGIARAAYEDALDYAKTRRQFGRPIIDNQGIAFTLADMRTRIDAARLLVWRASWMAATGSPSRGRGLDVQAVRQRDRPVGHRAGHADPRRQRLHPRVPVERLHRDAPIYTIFEGTSEIQRLVIARTLSGMLIR